MNKEKGKIAFSKILQGTAVLGVTLGTTDKRYIELLETGLSNVFDNRNVVATSSGTAALYVALKILGLKPGDRVIIPVYGCPAVPAAVCSLGALPLFVDITEDFGLDIDHLEEVIDDRVRGIISVNYFGYPENKINELKNITKERGLFLLEDCSQIMEPVALEEGLTRQWGVGDVVCASCSTGKPFSTKGNAGVLILRKEEYAKRARALRSYGKSDNSEKNEEVSLNFRLNETQAAILYHKQEIFKEILRVKTKLIKRYQEKLEENRNLSFPKTKSRQPSCFFIRTKKRNEVFQALKKAAGKEQFLYPKIPYPALLCDFDVYGGGGNVSSYPVAKSVSEELLLLPLEESLTIKQIDKISAVINSVF